MPDTRFFRNPHVSHPHDSPAATRAPLAFHQLLPGYATTPLVDASRLAASLGIAKVWVKDESSRMNLPAFKILGASWAIARALGERIGEGDPRYDTFADLVARVAPLRPLTLAAATDGNHGRAVARMAALLGFAARIFVPAGTAAARIDTIAGEGAAVTVVDGSYDDAVARAASEAGPRCLVISDTSWPGYEAIPRYVIEGYATIFWEVDDELDRLGAEVPDIVFVQIGVGALAAAVVRHYHAAGERPFDSSTGPKTRSGAASRGAAAVPVSVFGQDKPATNDQQRFSQMSLASPDRHIRPASSVLRPKIVGVEPTRAACVLASMQAGRLVAIPGPHDSIMAGLNCGTPSPVAWPALSSGIDLFMAIEDERAREAMRALANDGIVAGETGAAGAGGLIELCTAPDAASARAAIGLGPSSRVLLLCTEGATDPAAYRHILGP